VIKIKPTLDRHFVAIALATHVLSGCGLMNADYQPFLDDGYRLKVQERAEETRFWFDFLPDKFRELGGARSGLMIKFMEGELARNALCPHGYSIIDDGGGKGYYFISGRCKKPKLPESNSSPG